MLIAFSVFAAVGRAPEAIRKDFGNIFYRLFIHATVPLFLFYVSRFFREDGQGRPTAPERRYRNITE